LLFSVNRPMYPLKFVDLDISTCLNELGREKRRLKAHSSLDFGGCFEEPLTLLECFLHYRICYTMVLDYSSADSRSSQDTVAYGRRIRQSDRHVEYAQLLPSAYQSHQSEHPPNHYSSAWPPTKEPEERSLHHWYSIKVFPRQS
jgi:hypothetical protein